LRLFAAVLPPPAAVAELAAALPPLRRLPGARELRWTAAEGWHLTLVFLGEVPDAVRPELAERLGRAARRHGPHELRLTGGGHFGDRALWAGTEGDLAGLSRLADSVRAGARRAGAPVTEEHGLRAHLTLARTPRAADVPLRPLADALGAFRGSPWTADALSLVSSSLPRSGVPGEQPRYEPVGSWPLGRQALGR
jgi:2'-5' RNA ligase